MWTAQAEELNGMLRVPQLVLYSSDNEQSSPLQLWTVRAQVEA